jgi:protein-disulfide isomerase
MKRSLPFILIALVAVAAVAGGALLYRAKVAELTPVATKEAGEKDEPKKTEKGAHIRGNPAANVTVEEFADFQCPPCAAISPTLAKLEHEFESQMRVLFRNFPLQMHNHAAEAARAAEAAGLQGKFWQMHDLLYRNQNTWSKEADVRLTFINYAQEVGLDLGGFERDLESPEVRGRVSSDQARGTSLGVNRTPTLYINGQPLAPSSLNEQGLRAAIGAAIRGEAIPKETPTPAPPPVIPLAPSATPQP